MDITPHNYRLLLVACLATGLAGSGVDIMFPDTLPSYFREANAQADSVLLSGMPQEVVVSLVVAFALVSLATFLGLFLFRPWAPGMALFLSALGAVGYLFMGPFAQSGIVSALNGVSSSLWGAVVALACCGSARTFFERDASERG